MFTIDDGKLRSITQIINNSTDPEVTEDVIESHICADWQGGDEHQQWISTATPEEIADWIASTTY